MRRKGWWRRGIVATVVGLLVTSSIACCLVPIPPFGRCGRRCTAWWWWSRWWAPFGASTWSASFSGEQEVPASNSTATGTATFTLNEDLTELTFDIQATGLSGPVIEAQFRIAPEGAEGRDTFDLTEFVTQSGNDITINGVWGLDEVSLLNLLDADIYVDLMTAGFPAGEIRGQVMCTNCIDRF